MAEKMTAEEAYEAAREMIAEAQRIGAADLNFGSVDEDAGVGEMVHRFLPALTSLPSEIADIEGLRVLDFQGTAITDEGLSPIGSLTGLEQLFLTDTKTSDAALDHISGLKRLEELHLDSTQVTARGLAKLAHIPDMLQRDGNSGRLDIPDTPAMDDPRIAAIKGNGTFYGDDLRHLFNDLRATYPQTPKAPSDQPIGGRYHLPDEGPITSDPVHSQTVDDALEELKEELIEKAGALAQVLDGSNQYARLHRTAQRYQARLNRPIDQIRLDMLASAANTLRQALQAHNAADKAGELTKLLPAELYEPLSDLMQTHGPFWLSLPEAAEIERKARLYLDGQREPEVLEAAKEVARALEDKPDVLHPSDQETLEDDQLAAEGTGDAAELAEKTLIGRVWNIMGAVSRHFGKLVAGGTTVVASGVAGNAVYAWIVANKDVILGFLTRAQGTAANWFMAMLDLLF